MTARTDGVMLWQPIRYNGASYRYRYVSERHTLDTFELQRFKRGAWRTVRSDDIRDQVDRHRRHIRDQVDTLVRRTVQPPTAVKLLEEGEPSCPVTHKPCDRGPTCGVLRPCERRLADNNSPH